jgi:hypothetical protein
MNLGYTTWKNHEAIKITSGHCELIVGTSMGPRILSLQHARHHNLLYEDATGFSVGEWRLYGGHRFTIAPENDSSYYPDNEACTVHTVGEAVLVSAPMRPDGLRLSLKVSADEADCGFKIVHILENYGSTAWIGALWAITCIPRSARIAGSCTTNTILYWPGTDPAKWILADDLIGVMSGDFRGKTGWHESNGWLSATEGNTQLTIRNEDETIAGDCVDDGCNLEVFVCKDWIELETLGKQVVVSPGGFTQHVQRWLLVESA